VRALAGLAVIGVLAGCGNDPSIYEPASIAEIEQGRLTFEDQQALTSLRIDVRHARLFLPNTGQAGLLGSWLPIPLLGGLAAAVALLVFYIVRASRDDRPPSMRLDAPLPAPPSVPAPAPTPALPVGTAVLVKRANGEPMEGTIVDSRAGHYQCDIGGRRAWIPADRVSSK
jgi:hypothetical protein